MVREVARLMDEHVRRTDLLGWLSAETLLVLAPGIDSVGGRSLAMRLPIPPRPMNPRLSRLMPTG